MFRQMYEEKYMRFPEGKAKALTFSYDDGVKADKRLISIFNRYGCKATFNLNSLLFDCERWHDRMDEGQTYLTYYNSGHEVALHGARHIFLDKVPLPEAVNEIVQNRVWLENKFGRIVDGMAYAYNSYNDDVAAILKNCGVKYARTTESSYSFDLPTDRLRLKPTCHHGDMRLGELTERFLNHSPEEESKHRESWLFFVWGHSYEFDDNDNWEIIETLCRTVAGREDIWFATNGEILDYVKAYRDLIFSMAGERVKNPSALPVWLELRGKTYRIGSGETIAFDKEI